MANSNTSEGDLTSSDSRTDLSSLTMGSTASDSTHTTAASMVSGNSGGGYKGKKPFQKKYSYFPSTEPREWMGLIKEIGGVLALNNERDLVNKLGYFEFGEKFDAYVLNKSKGSEDALVIIAALKRCREGTDVTLDLLLKAYEEQFKPKREDGSMPGKDTMEYMFLEKEVEKYYSNLQHVSTTMRLIYTYLWGQCSKNLQSVVKSDPDFEKYSVIYDGLGYWQKLKRY